MTVKIGLSLCPLAKAAHLRVPLNYLTPSQTFPLLIAIMFEILIVAVRNTQTEHLKFVVIQSKDWVRCVNAWKFELTDGTIVFQWHSIVPRTKRGISEETFICITFVHLGLLLSSCLSQRPQ